MEADPGQLDAVGRIGPPGRRFAFKVSGVVRVLGEVARGRGRVVVQDVWRLGGGTEASQVAGGDSYSVPCTVVKSQIGEGILFGWTWNLGKKS